MIKKISEWLQELPEPYRELAIANYEKVKMHDPLYDSMEMALLCAFDWKSSNEGFEYWSDICDKIASSELNLKKQLAEVTEQRNALISALISMKQTEPSNHNGDLFYPRHSPDGDYLGEEPVDPIALLGGLYSMINEALASVEGGEE